MYLQNEVLARTCGRASRCTSISPPLSHRATATFRLPHPLFPADYFSLAYPQVRLPNLVVMMMPSALPTVIAAESSANFSGYNCNRRVAGTSWPNLDGSVYKVFPIAVVNWTCGRRESPAELAHAQDRAHHKTCHNLASLHDARMSQTHLEHACSCRLCSTFCRLIS